MECTNYSFTSDDCDNLYATLYSGVMEDCQKIIDKTSITDAASPHMKGMAEVLKANALGNSSLVCWGKHSQYPRHSGEWSVKNLLSMMNKQFYACNSNPCSQLAIADLSVSGTDYEEQYMKVAGQDLIYGGNTAIGFKAAYSFKSPYELRLSRQIRFQRR